MTYNIVDRIYEAAFVPDVWDSVLETTDRLSDSAGGAIFSFREGLPPRGRCVEHLRPLLHEFTTGDMWKSCHSANRMIEARPAEFVEVDHFLTEDEIQQDPIRVRLRAFGLESGLCAVIPIPGGDVVTFIHMKAATKIAYRPPEVEAMNALRPHLGRAALLAGRLGLEQAQNTVHVMEKLGLPAAVLTARGRVLAVNALLERLPKLFIPRAHGGLSLATSKADALLQTALAELSDEAHAAVRSIPIPAGEDHPAMVVHLLPLRRTARDIFTRADVLIAATEIRLNGLGPPTELLMGLFDLTPAEARLAATLTSGKSLQTAAKEQGIQFSTSRAYLSQIFRKTGTHQQSQLVALLRGAQPLRG